MADKSAQEVAVERQGQFELYLTGLAFTVLGLAIQTSKLGTVYFGDFTELAGWLCLLTSGLCGLRRLEQAPEHYRVQNLKYDQQAKLKSAQQLMLTQPYAVIEILGGGQTTAREYADRSAEAIQKVEKRLRALDKAMSWLYVVQRGTLVAGFALLALSRAVPGFAHVAKLFGLRLL